MTTTVINGPAALRVGRYWVGVASGNKYATRKRRTVAKALADARTLEKPCTR